MPLKPLLSHECGSKRFDGDDARGRVIRETCEIEGVTPSVAYAHDGAHRLVWITYPSGRDGFTLHRQFDLTGRLTMQKAGAVQRLGYSFDIDSNFTDLSPLSAFFGGRERGGWGSAEALYSNY